MKRLVAFCVNFVETGSLVVLGVSKWICLKMSCLVSGLQSWSVCLFYLTYFVTWLSESYVRQFEDYVSRVIVWGQAAREANNWRSFAKRFVFCCCYCADAAYSFGKKLFLLKVLIFNTIRAVLYG